MKTTRSLSFLAFASLLILTGCQDVDITPMATGNQVLTGTIIVPPDLTLPADTKINIFLLDTANHDVPVGSKEIDHPGASPIKFEVDYFAPDLELPHHVRIEARVEFGGKLRLRSGRNHEVTPGNAKAPFDLTLSELSGSEMPVSSAASPVTYTIIVGDTLAIIAQTNHVSIQALTAANPAVDWTKLSIGQVLKLPAPSN